jgi:hypothetical protein
VGSKANVVLPQFGGSADVHEAAGAVWKDGAFVSGVSGVTGATLDVDGNIVLKAGSGDFVFVVRV